MIKIDLWITLITIKKKNNNLNKCRLVNIQMDCDDVELAIITNQRSDSFPGVDRTGDPYAVGQDRRGRDGGQLPNAGATARQLHGPVGLSVRLHATEGSDAPEAVFAEQQHLRRVLPSGVDVQRSRGRRNAAFPGSARCAHSAVESREFSEGGRRCRRRF